MMTGSFWILCVIVICSLVLSTRERQLVKAGLYGGRMDYPEFLQRVIDDGIRGARRDYAVGSAKLRGSVAGFEACRKKSPAELKALLEESRKATQDAYTLGNVEIYWETRCYSAEIEWVCNVVSALLLTGGSEVIVVPTLRGMMQVGSILGLDFRKYREDELRKQEEA